MKSKVLLLSCLLFAILSFGQENYWTKLSRNSSDELRPRWTNPKVFSLYQLDLDKIKTDLKKAPQRFSSNENLAVKFPDSDGKIRNYIVQEASIMEPALQAQFPEMRTYIGWQKEAPSNTIRFSITPQTGISVMYFDGWDVSYLDSYTKNNSSYIIYKRKDLPKNDRLFECNVEDILDKNINLNSSAKAPLVSDGFLRTYRLALSATGEYTTFHGGTVPLAMAAMVTTMNRVNGIYEKTISVTMVMIANNTSLIYVNSATDPFTNGNPSSMITENQSNTTTIIGSATMT